MENRMHNWSTFFKVIGWIGVIGGLIGAIFTFGVTLAVVPFGIFSLLTCAILEWMDGITKQLMGIQENEREIASLLAGLCGKGKEAGKLDDSSSMMGKQAIEAFSQEKAEKPQEDVPAPGVSDAQGTDFSGESGKTTVRRTRPRRPDVQGTD